MKRLIYLLLVCWIALLISGCSVLVATPYEARVQVKGLNNQLNEYVIILNSPPESDLDIQLTNNYAIKLDLQWLWDENFLNQPEFNLNGESATAPLTPWLTCKYRF